MAETLGDRIRMQRARLRLSQGALAKQIGVSVMAISAIENGNVDPRASRIKKLAEVLGVTTDYLLEPEKATVGQDVAAAPTPPPKKRPRPRTAAPVG
jgi:transcriptional regulator with XRE-family HTH domain